MGVVIFVCFFLGFASHIAPAYLSDTFKLACNDEHVKLSDRADHDSYSSATS